MFFDTIDRSANDLIEFGHVKQGRAFRGVVLPNGDFRVDVEDGTLDETSPPASGALYRFVDSEALAASHCAATTMEKYLTP